MPTVLLVFEFLGTTELLVIAVVALIIFGPRKLPEIGRSVGKSLAEFKRASDDFKRTWEYEVELEGRKPALDRAPDATTPMTTHEGATMHDSAAHADATAHGSAAVRDSAVTLNSAGAEDFLAHASRQDT